MESTRVQLFASSSSSHVDVSCENELIMRAREATQPSGLPVIVEGPTENADDIAVPCTVVESPPYVGMLFDSPEACKQFYVAHARTKGFAIKTRHSRKGADNKLEYFILSCKREGRHEPTIDVGERTTPTAKISYPAKITVSAKNGSWMIMKVVEHHCHELSPTKSWLFAANKTINMHVRRTIELNEDAGVRLNKSFRSLVGESGGPENLTFVERDVRNYVTKRRRQLGKDGDGQALLAYFSRMKESNPQFFYEIDVDDDLRVQNVFWADARSRAAFEYVGDVVSFDTTYLTNKYDMPFAPFVGVNHHGQSILLGCGLLCSEDTKSFKWLFETWLRCMGSKPPIGIVIDQCKAMQNPIKEVFPNTVHRWCLWHIMKKIPEKLKSYGQYKSIKYGLKQCVYESVTAQYFDVAWAGLITKFKLDDNDWLSGIFLERTRWVPCYLKHKFWAGMSTTQRSKSMNAFFDGYINALTSLREFVRQYDNALQDKAEKEKESDFRSFSTTIPCLTLSPIEKQFQWEYTHAKFSEIQTEFRAQLNCSIRGLSIDGGASTYVVLVVREVCGQIKNDIFDVIFYLEDHNVVCTCKLFEFRGILCRHSLVVLGQERVKFVPTKFVLARWSKQVKRAYKYIKTSYDVRITEPKMERFDVMCKMFYEVADDASSSQHKTDDLTATLKTWFVKNKSNADSPQCSHGEDIDDITGQQSAVHTRSPLRVARKGRPRVKRAISTLEQITKRETGVKKQKSVVTDAVIWCSQQSVVSDNSFLALLASVENNTDDIME